MKNYWTRYLLIYPKVIVYMLQASEYHLGEYILWLNRSSDFRTIMRRKELDYTNKAKLLLLFLWLVSLTAYIYSIILITQSIGSQIAIFAIGGIIIFLVTPILIPYLVVIPLWLGEKLVQGPLEYKAIEEARKIIAEHPAIKIAIVGSYGKTTAKEVLATILREGKTVACTPSNMNTLLGISKFAKTLKGNEEILIFELGEEKVGDVANYCKFVNPNLGIITGISEAHLSSFGTIENIVSTIFEIENYLEGKPLYKNNESVLVHSKVGDSDKYAYTRNGVLGWRVSGAKANIEGTTVEITDDFNHTLRAHSGLLGYHNLGIIVASVAIADFLGLNVSQIEAGINNTAPFEHRMQPRNVNGAWIIDDTYNGNSEGVRAGLQLLKMLEAKRRIYVTPGLVEQGDKTREIHELIGRQIAVVADVVVLMKNSVTGHIQKGLTDAGFKGELQIIENPLEFYNNLDHFVALGDVVLMQNDWTDNYA